MPSKAQSWAQLSLELRISLFLDNRDVVQPSRTNKGLPSKPEKLPRQRKRGVLAPKRWFLATAEDSNGVATVFCLTSMKYCRTDALKSKTLFHRRPDHPQ